MAKFDCKCGAIIRDDDPAYSFYFLKNQDFDVDLSGVELFGRSKLAVCCKTCGRLWFWGEDGIFVEYARFQDE